MAAIIFKKTFGNTLLMMRQVFTRSQFATMCKEVSVTHDAKNSLFYVEVDSKKAFIQYEKNGNIMTLYETKVPEELEGRGLGKCLAEKVFSHIASNGLKMQLECPFLQHYVNKYGNQYQKFIAK